MLVQFSESLKFCSPENDIYLNYRLFSQPSTQSNDQIEVFSLHTHMHMYSVESGQCHLPSGFRFLFNRILTEFWLTEYDINSTKIEDLIECDIDRI